VRLEELGILKKSNDLIETRNRDLPAYSIMPQPTTLSIPPFAIYKHKNLKDYTCVIESVAAMRSHGATCLRHWDCEIE
jgi:hypothetical protein